MLVLDANSFDNIIDLIARVTEQNNSCAIICQYDKAAALICGLCKQDYIPYDISIGHPEWTNYYDEYLIEVAGDKLIYVEEAKREGKPVTFSADITFVFSDIEYWKAATED